MAIRPLYSLYISMFVCRLHINYMRRYLKRIKSTFIDCVTGKVCAVCAAKLSIDDSKLEMCESRLHTKKLSRRELCLVSSTSIQQFIDILISQIETIAWLTHQSIVLLHYCMCMQVCVCVWVGVWVCWCCVKVKAELIDPFRFRLLVKYSIKLSLVSVCLKCFLLG